MLLQRIRPKIDLHGEIIDFSQDEIKSNLTKLENKIRTQFLPKLTGRVSPEDNERSMLEPSARLGGLNIINPETDAAQKFKDSERLCKPLVEKILSGDTDLDEVASRQKRASTEIQKENKRRAERKKDVVVQSLVITPYSRAFELANKRGASNWLTTLPLEELGFCTSKAAFRDALCMRYIWPLKDVTFSLCLWKNVLGSTLLDYTYWRLPSYSV